MNYTNNVRLTSGMKVLVVHSVCADLRDIMSKAERLNVLIVENNADLLIIDGDAVAEGLDERERGEVFDSLTAKIDIPTIRIFGDNETAEDRKNLVSVGAYAVSEFGDAVYLVYGYDNKVVSALWCMDSHRGVGDYEKDFASPHRARPANPLYSRYYLDGIRFCQTMWYRRISADMTGKFGVMSGTMLFHTPIPEHILIPCNAEQTEMLGHQGERLRCQTVNGGIFASAVEMKNIREIICGHCEKGVYNDFSGHYCGITLTMAPSFEFGAYLFRL